MYGKLFAQMFDGTLGTKGPWEALVTFQQLVILADKTGAVDMTADAISRRTTVPLEIIERGLSVLALPDPDSRSPDEGGRRIVPIDPDRNWGWVVVNYGHYRKIRTEEERREYHREYGRKRRAKSKQDNAVTPSQQINTASSESTNSSKQYAGSRKQEAGSKNPPQPPPEKPPTTAATMADRFANPDHRDAYLALHRSCGHPPSFDAAIRGLLQGITEAAFTPEQLGSGMMDMAAKRVQASPTALRRFAQYARNAEGAPEATPRPPRPADSPLVSMDTVRRLEAEIAQEEAARAVSQ